MYAFLFEEDTQWNSYLDHGSYSNVMCIHIGVYVCLPLRICDCKKSKAFPFTLPCSLTPKKKTTEVQLWYGWGVHFSVADDRGKPDRLGFILELGFQSRCCTAQQKHRRSSFLLLFYGVILSLLACYLMGTRCLLQ